MLGIGESERIEEIEMVMWSCNRWIGVSSAVRRDIVLSAKSVSMVWQTSWLGLREGTLRTVSTDSMSSLVR